MTGQTTAAAEVPMRHLFIYDPDPWFVDNCTPELGRQSFIETLSKEEYDKSIAHIDFALALNAYKNEVPCYRQVRIYTMNKDGNYVLQETIAAERSAYEFMLEQQRMWSSYELNGSKP